MSQVELKDCQTCAKSANNKYFNCPNRMDYAFMTNWQPRCSAVYAHLKNTPFKDSLSQRMYLTHNAEELMAKNAQDFYNMMNCPQCVTPWDQGTMLPEQTTQTCNSRVCEFRTNDPYGLGFGRQYWDQNQEAEAKKAFIKSKEIEQANFKQVSSCCGTQQDDERYYPIDNNIKSQYERNAIPGGGTQMRGGDRLRS
jgi:hypothetical protein